MKITGQILKENREKRNISLSEVSSATKINSKTLEFIEEGDLQKLPAMTFLRGFIRTYAGYLKLDVDQVMQTFLEETSGVPPRHPIEIEPFRENDAESPQSVITKSNLASKYIAVFGIVLLIALIVTVKELIEKYEREREVVVPQNIDKLSEATPPSPDQNALLPLGPKEEKEVTLPERPEPPKPAAQEAPPVAASPDPTPATKPTPPPPAPAPVPTPPPVAPSPPQPVATQTPPPAPKVESTKKSSQELIIEALDRTEIKYTTGEGKLISVSLKPEQVYIIKADTTVKLTAKDGGALNIIHNGRDLGVPGDLGKSVTLTYP